MTRTLSLEGDITASDTSTALSSQVDISDPSRKPSTGFTRITSLYSAIGIDGAGTGSAVFMLEIGGSNIKTQTIMIGGCGIVDPQSGSDTNSQASMSNQIHDLDIDISDANEIDVSCRMCGSDLGSATVGVTLVFA